MNKQQYLSQLNEKIVRNNWDLPTPGRTIDLSNQYYGPDKPIQERLKEEGRKLKDDAHSIDNRLIGCGLEAHGHFYRSLEAAIGCNRAHPDKFSEYFPHWLHSDPAYLPKELFTTFANWYKKPQKIKIKKGESYWKY